MYIESIRVRNFRNYQNQAISFKNGMNILIGPNGIGKTNLLEALFLLSTTRSHRNNDEKEIIRINNFINGKNLKYFVIKQKW